MDKVTKTDISDQWSNEADYTFDAGILSPTRPPVGLPSAVFPNTWLTNSEVCPATGRPEENKRYTLKYKYEEGIKGREEIWNTDTGLHFLLMLPRKPSYRADYMS